MVRDIPQLITNLPLFAGYTIHGARDLVQLGEVRMLEPGARACSEGEPPSYAGLLLEGKLRVFVTRGGRELTLGELEAGSVFGEVGVLCALPRSATLAAHGAALLLTWESRVFRRTLLENAFFGERIFRQAFRTLLENERRLIDRIVQ